MDINSLKIITTIVAVIGCFITIVINWDKISGALLRLKRKFSKQDQNELIIDCLRDYLIHYGYDFDNGKGRDFFHIGDLEHDIKPNNIFNWVVTNYDEAINGLIQDGYLERRESIFKGCVKVTEAGRNYYSSIVKKRIESSIKKIEKHVSSSQT
jgi:hypothetical protein